MHAFASIFCICHCPRDAKKEKYPRHPSVSLLKPVFPAGLEFDDTHYRAYLETASSFEGVRPSPTDHRPRPAKNQADLRCDAQRSSQSIQSASNPFLSSDSSLTEFGVTGSHDVFRQTSGTACTSPAKPGRTVAMRSLAEPSNVILLDGTSRAGRANECQSSIL